MDLCCLPLLKLINKWCVKDIMILGGARSIVHFCLLFKSWILLKCKSVSKPYLRAYLTAWLPVAIKAINLSCQCFASAPRTCTCTESRISEGLKIVSTSLFIYGNTELDGIYVSEKIDFFLSLVLLISLSHSEVHLSLPPSRTRPAYSLLNSNAWLHSMN